MDHRLLGLLLTLTLLAACGGEKAGAEGSVQGDNALPKPGAVSGSVTGMPNPGSASAQRPAMQGLDIIELPEQADTFDVTAGDVAMQSPTEGDPVVGVVEQSEPELSPQSDASQDDATQGASAAPEPIPAQH